MAEFRPEPWTALLACDPRPWLVECTEPAARRVTLTSLLDCEPGNPEVRQSGSDVLTDPATAALINRLPDWERDADITDHSSPTFPPRILGLLWAMGVRAGDSPRIERLLDQMLDHQDGEGRFQTFSKLRGKGNPRWGSLLCDTHAITEMLIRFGRAGDPRVQRSLRCMESDLIETSHGPGWPCRPDDETAFRGPGRKGDICPQVTVEALRLIAHIGPSGVSAALEGSAEAAAHTMCNLWLRRGESKPYMFGHGRQFKTVKWPPLWYNAYSVLDALSLYPSLWHGAGPMATECRRAVRELAACLVAYNFSSEGRVTPQSCYRGFEEYSWGQKKKPSPFATALLCTVLRRLNGLAGEIATVDVLGMGSSKGGTGRAVPPRV